MKQREYMINAWHNVQSYGTSCVMRTTDKKEWIDKIREIVKENCVHRSDSRTVVHEDITIWSYCVNTSGRQGFQDTVFWNKPLQLKMGWPKEVDE